MMDAKPSGIQVMIPRSILIADDDRLVRESLCEVFADLGCEPTAAANGGAAIVLLSRSHCDLLLSDVDMPDMTGFQLLDWVRAHPPLTATALMSARADAHLAERARAEGAITLLAKPVPVTEITALVHSLFHH